MSRDGLPVDTREPLAAPRRLLGLRPGTSSLVAVQNVTAWTVGARADAWLTVGGLCEASERRKGHQARIAKQNCKISPEAEYF